RLRHVYIVVGSVLLVRTRRGARDLIGVARYLVRPTPRVLRAETGVEVPLRFELIYGRAVLTGMHGHPLHRRLANGVARRLRGANVCPLLRLHDANRYRRR